MYKQSWNLHLIILRVYIRRSYRLMYLWLGENILDCWIEILYHIREIIVQQQQLFRLQMAIYNDLYPFSFDNLGKSYKNSISQIYQAQKRTFLIFIKLNYAILKSYILKIRIISSQQAINKIYNLLMNFPSQLVEIQITQGQKTTKYYTYDGYYQQEDRKKIRQFRKKIEKNVWTDTFATGFLSYHVSKRFRMPQIAFGSYRAPLKGLLTAVIVSTCSLLLFDYIGTQQIANFERSIALKSHHLPLWLTKSRAVNPDRVFFELIDSMNNEPSIFHSGLTELAAASLIPDKIIGTPPAPPSIYKNIH